MKLMSTSMTANGQVEIPKDIRKALKLQPGDQFVAFYRDDVVMLKVVTPPPIEDIGSMLKEARKWARKVGLKKSDLKEAIAKVRGKK